MPHIDDILDSLVEAHFISKIDLNNGFHQIGIAPEDQCKAAFVCLWGQFHYVVMPFGVKKGPTVFQRLILRGCKSFSEALY